MKNLVILGCILLASCKKTTPDLQVSIPNPTNKQSCDFGMTSFNLVKRPPVNYNIDEALLRGKPNGNNNINTSGGTTGGLIYLDFDGQLVSGTSWNTNGPINCAPANLTAIEINEVVLRVSNDFSAFNATVTTDEATFNNYTGKRMRVIITESWEWWGQAGGVAYLGTMTAGSTTPCFVFSSLLNYKSKAIAEAASHETGHTVGLHHQSTYDANRVKIAEYNAGQGTGEIAWAPIMGNSYSRNLSLWHKGPNATGYNNIQDDVAMITSALGAKTDDYSNTLTNAATLSTAVDGVVNNATDVDVFKVTVPAAATLTLTPFNVGLSNAGSNIDLVMNVYNSQGTLMTTINDAILLNAATAIAPGTYFISVGNASNANTTTHGMSGRYNIRIN